MLTVNGFTMKDAGRLVLRVLLWPVIQIIAGVLWIVIKLLPGERHDPEG
jgi:hypothetical protein